MFERIVAAVNAVVWSPALVVLLVGTGLWFTFRGRFVQLRRIGLMARLLTRKRQKDSNRQGVSSFEAFCIALAGRVGTGNIVGVATAIAMGGPGAIFWMWIIAFFGASTAYVESTLAQIYKFTHSSGFRGGPFCYIEKGLKARWLAILFAAVTVLACGLLMPGVQSNGMSAALNNSFGVSNLTSGLALVVLVGLVIVGGVRRIAKAASFIAPFMAIAYLLLAVTVLVVNWRSIPGTFALIIENAFGINPLCGGILGSTIMFGVKRGLYSNEAGQGTGAIPSASADVDHPAEQGLVQAFSVYVDTIFVCTATALMILSSGTFNIFDAKTGEMLLSNAPELGAIYVGYTQAAVESAIGGFGGSFISIALSFFVFTTIMADYFYSESSVVYLCGGKKKTSPALEKALIWMLRIFVLGSVIFGSLKDADTVWTLGDIGLGLMAWINVIAIIILAPKAFAALKDYERR